MTNFPDIIGLSKQQYSAIDLTGLKVLIITSRKILCIFGNMSSFRKNDRNFTELENGGNHLTQPCEVAAIIPLIYSQHRDALPPLPFRPI
jgi:hypothetical protein